MLKNNPRAQGSLEYLLLFAAAFVIVIIAIVIWLNTLSAGENIATNQEKGFEFDSQKAAFGEQYFLDFRWAKPDLVTSPNHYALWQMTNHSDFNIQIDEISFEAVGDTDHNITLDYLEINSIPVCCSASGLLPTQWYKLSAPIIVPGKGGFVQGNFFEFGGAYTNEGEALVMRFKFSDGSIYRPSTGLVINIYGFSPYDQNVNFSLKNRMAPPYQTICEAQPDGTVKEENLYNDLAVKKQIIPETFILATDLNKVDTSGDGTPDTRGLDYATTLSWDLGRENVLNPDNNVLFVLFFMPAKSFGSQYSCTSPNVPSITDPLHIFLDFDPGKTGTTTCTDIVNSSPDDATKFQNEAVELMPYFDSCGTFDPNFPATVFYYDFTDSSQNLWKKYIAGKSLTDSTFRIKLIGSDLDSPANNPADNDKENYRVYAGDAYPAGVEYKPYFWLVYSTPV